MYMPFRAFDHSGAKNSVHIMTKVNVGPHVSLSNGGKPEMPYNLKGLPMKTLEVRSGSGWFG